MIYATLKLKKNPTKLKFFWKIPSLTTQTIFLHQGVWGGFPQGAPGSLPNGLTAPATVQVSPPFFGTQKNFSASMWNPYNRKPNL